MQVEILTPVSSIYSGNADSVSLPGLDGVFQVLNGHASIISSLKKGEINMSLSEKFDAEKFGPNRMKHRSTKNLVQKCTQI